MAKARYSWLINAFQTLVLLALIAYLFSSLNFRELGKMMVRLNTGWLVVPILLHLGAVWLNAYRWMILLKAASEYPIPLWRLAYSQVVGQFFSVFLPSDMGGDVYKIHDIHKFYKSHSKSIVSVFLTRVFGFLAMGAILTVGLIISHNMIRLQSIFWIALTYSLFSFAAIALLIEKKLLTLILEKSDFTKEIKNKYILKLVNVFKELNAVMTNRKAVLSTLLLSFIFQILAIVIIFFYGLTVNIILSFQSLLLVVPLIMLISALPISINSLGLREGAFVYFLGWLGLTNEQGMFVALLSRLVSGIIIPLIGGMLFVLLRRRIDKTPCRYGLKPE
ncbi:MAG: hypothetical protein BWK80_10990 [Desulfobacteraceae bacterium IS3]|nr:MAG: hypothetical protein BWK80_10990 [Desulfobacteraceae bacterium IS3]